MSNAVVPQERKKFSLALQSEGYQNLIKNTLRDPKKVDRFIATISSAVATNPALQTCESGSILSSALLGEALNLSPSPQLGQYYMVPYNRKENKNKGITAAVLAQFQLGYKGYIQLALRSNFYLKINVLDIKKGELVRFNPLLEEIEVNLIDDELERESAETTGYYAMFEYLNGFRKEMYWSKNKMISHADKYSGAFSRVMYEKLIAGQIPKDDLWKYSSFWYKDFDSMAFKTMLRQLISKWGIMSTEMSDAFVKDGMAANSENGDFDYIDGTSEPIAGNDLIEPSDDQSNVVNEFCTSEQFAKIRSKYFDHVANKKMASEKLIADMNKKHALTDDQQAEILNWSEANA